MDNKVHFVTETMREMGSAELAAHHSLFFKTAKGEYGYGDKFLGIKVPETRKLVSFLWKELSIDDLACLISSPYHEIRLFALLVLVKKYETLSKQLKKINPASIEYDEINIRIQRIIDFYLARTKYINNWDLVDLSCYKILGDWLRDKERTLLYDLAESGYLWEERISVVSCLAFIKKGDFTDIKALAVRFLDHKHDLMHKAVGWMLREMGKVDELSLMEFLDEYAGRMPRTSLRYAIERLDENIRQSYLNIKRVVN